MIGLVFGGPQKVLILATVESNRHGVVGKQVDHRRAVQAHIVFAGADALATDLADIKTQGKATCILQQLGGHGLEAINATDFDKQEFLLEGVVLLQVAVTPEGIIGIGDQRMVFVKSGRLYLF